MSSSLWAIGHCVTVVCLLAANPGSNCSLMRATDGRIVCCGSISSCQSAATSEIVKNFSSRLDVRSTVVSTELLPWLFGVLCDCMLALWCAVHYVTATSSDIYAVPCCACTGTTTRDTHSSLDFISASTQQTWSWNSWLLAPAATPCPRWTTADDADSRKLYW